MELLSLSKMITAELRGSLAFGFASETPDINNFEAFDSVLPLPMWLSIARRDLRYVCPVARLLAAQNHLDGNFLASRWRALMLSSREKILRDSGGARLPKSLEGDCSSLSTIFSLVEETQLTQEGSSLSWTLGERGLRRWLSVGAASAVLGNSLAVQHSPLYDLTGLKQRRTAEREFGWQYSYGSSSRLIRRWGESRGKIVNERCSVEGDDKLKNSLSKASQLLTGLAWEELLPLVLAQMTVVDAMVLAPPKVIFAVDQLSIAWVNWLSAQVLNNLCLSQMAESLPVVDVACLTNALLGLSIQGLFEVDPVERL